MDGEDFIFILVIFAFLASPFLILLSIFSCIAYGRTKEWEKEKAARFSNLALDDVEGEALVRKNANNLDSYGEDDGAVSDADSLDSEEEAQKRAEEAEKEADWNLTKGQKFRKELKKCWKGRSPSELQKEREREEAKRIEEAVAKGIERHERRRERRARKALASNGSVNGQSSSTIVGYDAGGLPSYSNAVAASENKSAGLGIST